MSLLRKLIVLSIGLPLLVLGVILVPLPGPGLALCFLALLILSLEFDSAKGYLDMTKKVFKDMYRAAKERADKIEKR